jgi:hypothetical protein
MCCESWFFPECAANHIIFQNVQSVMFCPHNYILMKKMISSTFWEKNMVGSTFCGKNMIGSTFWEKT